jgi:hypothetical protein
LDLKIEAFYFRMNSKAFQLANSFSASRTAWPWQITANRTIFSRRISRSSYFYITKIGLDFLFKPLFLNDFTKVQVTFQMTLLFCSFIYSLLIFMFAGLAFSDFESLVIVNFCHFIRILKKILFKVPQFFLYNCFSFVLIDLADCSRESFISPTMAGFRYSAWHYIYNQKIDIYFTYIRLYRNEIALFLRFWISNRLFRG